MIIFWDNRTRTRTHKFQSNRTTLHIELFQVFFKEFMGMKNAVKAIDTAEHLCNALKDR